MKTLTFTASANTGFRYMPVTSLTIDGAAQTLMDSQTTFRMPRSDGLNGAELIRTLVDKLDQMMRAEVGGLYQEGQHSALVDAIRRTVDLLQLVAEHPNAVWSTTEGEAPDPVPLSGEEITSEGAPLPGTLV